MKDRPPIVTWEEIQSAKDLCPHSMGGCKILEINPSTILKVGPVVHMGEAEALCLLRKRTSVPVPEVFNPYTIADYGFILMSKIAGVTLRQCWKDLTRMPRVLLSDSLTGLFSNGARLKGRSLDLSMVVHVKMSSSSIHGMQRLVDMDLS